MLINRISALALLTLALCLSASSAQAQRAGRVGIVVTLKINVSDDEARQLATSLGAAIHDELAVDVISGSETERRLPEGGLPDECVADVTCRTDLGKRLDADQLLMLVVLRLGSNVQIDSTWAHVASGDTNSRPKITIKAGDDPSVVFAKAAPSLLPHIEKPKAEPRPQDNIIVVAPPTVAGNERSVPMSSWIAGAIGVGSLVGGTVFAISVRQKFDALDSDGCRDVACDQARIESLNRRALTADVLFGVSAAAATTALVLYLVSPPRAAASEEAPRARLRPGPGSIGLAVGGDF